MLKDYQLLGSGNIEPIKNILSGIKLVLFRPVFLWDFCFGKWQSTWLMLLLIGVSALTEYLSAGWGSRLNQPAVADFMLLLALALAGFFLIAQFLGYKNNGRFIVVALASMIVATILSSIVELLVSLPAQYAYDAVDIPWIKQLIAWLPFVVFIVLMIWLIAAITRAIRISFLTSWPRSLVFSILYFLLLGIASFALTSHGPLFRL